MVAGIRDAFSKRRLLSENLITVYFESSELEHAPLNLGT